VSHLRTKIDREIGNLREAATNLEDVEQGVLALEAALERKEKLMKEADAALEAANFKVANCGDQIRALEVGLRDTASQLEKANSQNHNQWKVIQSIKNILPDWEVDGTKWEFVPSNPEMETIADMDRDRLRSKYLVERSYVAALQKEVDRLKGKLEAAVRVIEED
jgi:predicted  nucleic acid-binding Zn-ribbon protein